uniref:POLAc domain-containing protein n=1 Tax=Gongylonema pulchrum TaxID=637853 RepID=A0A183D332_9BILA
LKNYRFVFFFKIISELLDINLTPSKPAYGLSPASPLCLFDCAYDGIELSWRWDIESLKSVRTHILKSWAEYQSRSIMLRNMAESIGLLITDEDCGTNALNDYLRPAVTSTKVYVPIRKRGTCDALELKQEKIRRKMAKLKNTGLPS